MISRRMNESSELTRRTALGLSLGVLTSLGGCLSQSLSIQEIEDDTTEAGTITALVAVANDGSSATSAQLTVQCNVISGDTYTKTRQITVVGSRTNTYRFEFDVQDSEVDNRYEIAASISKDRLSFLGQL
jgi:hypothetical protein